MRRRILELRPIGYRKTNEVPRSKFANGDFEMVNVSQVSCDNHPVSRGKPFDMILHVILAKFLETA